MRYFKEFLGLSVSLGIVFTSVFISKAQTNTAYGENHYFNKNGYNETYIYTWEDMYEVRCVRDYSYAGRRVKTTVQTSGSYGGNFDAMCVIGDSFGNSDHDRKSASLNQTYTLSTAESYSIFKKMKFTGHFVRFNTSNITISSNKYSKDDFKNSTIYDDMSFAGFWIYTDDPNEWW